MFVISVIPLKKGIPLTSLSYYTGTQYDVGCIVTIPIRNQNVMAVVIETTEASSAKTTLRAATFSLRKLPPQEHTDRIAPGLLATAEAIPDYYPTTLSLVLTALLPSEIRRGDHRFPQIFKQNPEGEDHQPELLMAPRHDRFMSIKSLIRSTFAHGGSIVIVAPSKAMALPIIDAIKTGIEERLVVMLPHSKKQIERMYPKYEDCTTPKVFVTTPSHAFLDRHDITTIVIEGARSPHYKMRTQPFLDYRDALLIYGQLTGKRVVMADTFLRSDEEALLRTGHCVAHDEHPKRLNLPGKIIYHERPKEESGIQYNVLTPSVVEAMDSMVAARKHIFLFCPRRGLAPMIGCSDCGHIFRCPDSGAPYSLLETPTPDGQTKRWFIAKASGKKVPAADTCPSCGSWKLKELGIGIQSVHKFVRDQFPSATITVVDKSTTTTEQRARLAVENFYKGKGGILLGTAMVFPFLTRSVNSSIITSLDAIRATPTWRSQEELFGLLMQLREISKETVLLQGKGDADEVITLAKKGMVERFYTEELALRQILQYPPYTRFIHLAWRAQSETGKAFGETIKKKFTGYNVTQYTDPTQLGDKKTFYTLIKVAEADWPDATLMKKLKSLPASVRVTLNPDRII